MHIPDLSGKSNKVDSKSDNIREMSYIHHRSYISKLTLPGYGYKKGTPMGIPFCEL